MTGLSLYIKLLGEKNLEKCHVMSMPWKQVKSVVPHLGFLMAWGCAWCMLPFSTVGLCVPPWGYQPSFLLWPAFSLAAWHWLGPAVMASAVVTLLCFFCWSVFSVDWFFFIWMCYELEWGYSKSFRSKSHSVSLSRWFYLHSSPVVHYAVILCLNLRR